MAFSPDISRRRFVTRIAKGLFGCSFGPRFAHATEKGLPIGGSATADSMIYLYMDGGMSHLDTFDLRPNRKQIQGPLESIRTKVPGTHVTSKLPGLAAQMDKIAQIRSMTHPHSNHAKAKSHVRTGNDMGSSALAHPDPYTEPVRLMASEDLDGFDISKEPNGIQELYGKSPFGQGCLLARRLVERGTRFIEVGLGGWDTHTDNHARVADNCGILDEGLSALLTDLSAKGMLERTLVVLTTEFGRSPRIDGYGGRNHNHHGFTSLLMGGGVTGGAVYGKTETDGHGVSENPVTVHDFNATIAYALGLGHPEMEPALGDSPSSLAGTHPVPETGKPVTAIFS